MQIKVGEVPLHLAVDCAFQENPAAWEYDAGNKQTLHWTLNMEEVQELQTTQCEAMDLDEGNTMEQKDEKNREPLPLKLQKNVIRSCRRKRGARNGRN